MSGVLGCLAAGSSRRRVLLAAAGHLALPLAADPGPGARRARTGRGLGMQVVRDERQRQLELPAPAGQDRRRRYLDEACCSSSTGTAATRCGCTSARAARRVPGAGAPSCTGRAAGPGRGRARRTARARGARRAGPRTLAAAGGAAARGSTGPSPRSPGPVHRSRTVAQPDPLTDDVTALLHAAETAARTPHAAATLADARRRLAQPLRVAVAGKLKAGKSTLLNALLGRGARRDRRGRVHQVVTWYLGADQARVVVHTARRSDPPPVRPQQRRAAGRPRRARRRGRPRRGRVADPSRLADLTVIDTPGIASLSTDVSARTYRAAGRRRRPARRRPTP